MAQQLGRAFSSRCRVQAGCTCMTNCYWYIGCLKENHQRIIDLVTDIRQLCTQLTYSQADITNKALIEQCPIEFGTHIGTITSIYKSSISIKRPLFIQSLIFHLQISFFNLLLSLFLKVLHKCYGTL